MQPYSKLPAPFMIISPSLSVSWQIKLVYYHETKADMVFVFLSFFPPCEYQMDQLGEIWEKWDGGGMREKSQSGQFSMHYRFKAECLNQEEKAEYFLWVPKSTRWLVYKLPPPCFACRWSGKGKPRLHTSIARFSEKGPSVWKLEIGLHFCCCNYTAC